MCESESNTLALLFENAIDRCCSCKAESSGVKHGCQGYGWPQIGSDWPQMGQIRGSPSQNVLAIWSTKCDIFQCYTFCSKRVFLTPKLTSLDIKDLNNCVATSLWHVTCVTRVTFDICDTCHWNSWGRYWFTITGKFNRDGRFGPKVCQIGSK